MTEKQLLKYCRQTNEPPERHVAAWPKFVESMHDKRYGLEPTTDAWLWFLEGWYACRKYLS